MLQQVEDHRYDVNVEMAKRVLPHRLRLLVVIRLNISLLGLYWLFIGIFPAAACAIGIGLGWILGLAWLSWFWNGLRCPCVMVAL